VDERGELASGVILGSGGACEDLSGGDVDKLALRRAMTAMLYGVRPGDPATFVGVAALMCAAGVFAAFWPARRAARVDPMVALRGE